MRVLDDRDRRFMALRAKVSGEEPASSSHAPPTRGVSLPGDANDAAIAIAAHSDPATETLLRRAVMCLTSSLRSVGRYGGKRCAVRSHFVDDAKRSVCVWRSR